MENKPKGFKIGFAKEVRPSDPESLFHDLKRAPEFPHLWSHQADVLRAYHKRFLKASDVALELPTGAGKTLVGLLLGEYRRQNYKERVIYLCPTRQLVHQVANQAKQYGVNALTLLAPEYKDISSYSDSSTIGITTYSSLFNTNPRIVSPEIIILDDSHSAEDYVAKMWSVSVNRKLHEDIYKEMLDVFSTELEDHFTEQMLNEEPTPDIINKVDVLPFPFFWKHVGMVRKIFDTKLSDREDARFAWSMIRSHLHACCIYISWNELLVRPMIPPTMTHMHFARAKQRIYMSATLGEGGELERTIGVQHIERIRVSRGWYNHNSGRRLFLFPNKSSMEEDQIQEALTKAVKLSERALILAPRKTEIDKIKNYFEKQETYFDEKDITVLGAEDIKESLVPFTSKKNVVLALANRYDGIDLPGQSCRLLVIQGLPVGTNLQERFLMARLAATSLLRDRIRTRLIQGVGRCCRNSTDYCGVIVAGSKLLDFCSQHEIRASMDPELQAEIEFGIENSKELDVSAITDLLKLLYEQGNDWQAANDEIINIREGIINSSRSDETDQATKNLLDVARFEVAFVYELWKKDYIAALHHAGLVADKLTGNDIAGYRAWWNYLAGCTAWLEGKEHSDSVFINKATEFFYRAAREAHSITWLAGLAGSLGTKKQVIKPELDSTHVSKVIATHLMKLGFSGPKFLDKVEELLEAIKSEKSKNFDGGLQSLGTFLGFRSVKPEGEAAPDAVWCLLDQLAIAFEAKREEIPEELIPVKTVRQALTHATWVRKHHSMKDDAKIIVVIVTARSSIRHEAKQLAQELCYQHPDDIQNLADAVVATYRNIRARASTLDQEVLIQIVQEQLSERHLLPEEIIKRFSSKQLSSLPTSNANLRSGQEDE